MKKYEAEMMEKVNNITSYPAIVSLDISIYGDVWSECEHWYTLGVCENADEVQDRVREFFKSEDAPEEVEDDYGWHWFLVGTSPYKIEKVTQTWPKY